ncbi:MAG: DUF5368 domain-containing protein [Neomegalonema sp.]|nr:DUF5368 domain-containing protein [Neomegalonema sp.]
MGQLSIATLIAIFQEMLGPVVFWALVVIAPLGLIAFLYVLIAQRGVFSRAFLRAEVIGLIGGTLSVFVLLTLTNSSITDMGGPIDIIALASVWIGGAIGSAMIAYTIIGLLLKRRSD